MKFRFALFLILLFMAAAIVPAFAAPRNGACFYKDEYFRGSSFCINAGESQGSLPGGFTDEISSIRIYGNASVTVYQDQNFRGGSERFTSDVQDLRQVRKDNDSSHSWNNRISSIRVDSGRGWGNGNGNGGWNRGNGNPGGNRGNNDRDNDNRDWNRGNNANNDWGRNGSNRPNFPTWGRGPRPNRGACFYRDRDFRGDYFCMKNGEEFRSLPSMRDDISSIKVYGGARVVVFEDSDFRGSSARFRNDITDLRNSAVRDDRDHTWNNRISSIQVQ